MYGYDIFVEFQGYFWNSIQNISPIYWKVQLLYNVDWILLNSLDSQI